MHDRVRRCFARRPPSLPFALARATGTGEVDTATLRRAPDVPGTAAAVPVETASVVPGFGPGDQLEEFDSAYAEGGGNPVSAAAGLDI